MVLCPVAIGCKKCPIFAIYPFKGVIGDYKKGNDVPTKTKAGSTNGGARKR